MYGAEYSLCRENILVLDIFFEALNYETIEQKKAYEVAALLGKSGYLLHKFPHLGEGGKDGGGGVDRQAERHADTEALLRGLAFAFASDSLFPGITAAPEWGGPQCGGGLQPSSHPNLGPSFPKDTMRQMS